VYDAASKLVRNEEHIVSSQPRDTRKVVSGIEGPCFVDIKVEAGGYKTSNFYCVSAQLNRYKWDKSDWWGIPMEKYADMQFVSKLPAAKVALKVVEADGGYDVTLTNSSAVIAYQNILKAKDDKGSLIPGTFWSDNFFTVLPGESCTVHCTLPEGCKKAHVELAGWNAKTE
jgi:hypothetical protein